MDTLEQLIAKFDREYPDDMKLAREALQANPLKASDLIGIDITDALLCHEINRLRAELAECREDAENWRMMRRQLGDLIDAAEAGERSVIGACATYIAVCANDVGADNAKFDMDGVTDSAGTECGDWVVTVTRKGEGG